LRQLSQHHHLTLFMTVLTGWALLLSRLSGEQEVVIGVPFANRGSPETEPLIGFFANAVPVRIQVDPRHSVAQLLKQVGETVLAVQQHQHIPQLQIVQLVQPQRSRSYNALFQATLAWQGGASRALNLPGLQAAALPDLEHGTTKFDLTLSLHDGGDALGGWLEYASALFDAATVQRFALYLHTLLDGMAADAAQASGRVPLLTAAQQTALLEQSRTPALAAAE
ncbi:condensation domain-containing protein, partial [Rugamonas sp. A1-17]|nr:condensation domain-containing protein [Rugamonas sp. A1-17]